MDLSTLSDSDLHAISSGDMSKVSDEGLHAITKAPVEEKSKSGYEGIPDKDLAWYQKGEKALEKVGLIEPGHEYFSPGALKNLKTTAKVIGPAVGAVAVMGTGTTPLGDMIAPYVTPAIEKAVKWGGGALIGSELLKHAKGLMGGHGE